MFQVNLIVSVSCWHEFSGRQPDRCRQHLRANGGTFSGEHHGLGGRCFKTFHKNDTVDGRNPAPVDS